MLIRSDTHTHTHTHVKSKFIGVYLCLRNTVCFIYKTRGRKIALPCPNAGKPIPVPNPPQYIMVGACCFAPKLPNPPNPVEQI